MRWGVTYSALLVNGVFTMEVFLLTKNLLTLALALPIHGVCALLCARDARFFDLAAPLGAHPNPGAARERAVLEVEQLLAVGCSICRTFAGGAGPASSCACLRCVWSARP